MNDMEALAWIDLHVFYTLHWYKDSISRGELDHWDFVIVEWVDESERVHRADVVVFCEFATTCVAKIK